jgi:putative DNA-invertase from lambdoid prophage Rac
LIWLGRDAIDVFSTVAKLEALGIRVHCLALGGVDLTSSAGKLTMGVINAVAQFERDLLIERTQAGLARARAEGKRMGRPPALSTAQQRDVKIRLQAGNAVAAIARDIGVSRQTIMRVATSTGRRNTLGELLCWSLILQGLAGPFVELPCDCAEFCLGMDI